MDQNQLRYGISLKLRFKKKAFEPGMSVLPRGVESTSSLQEAARAMDMTYSRAWKMLKESEKTWRFMLTERETEGRDGGGSTLTPQAARFLKAYDAFMAETRQELNRLLEQHFPQGWMEELRQPAEWADE